MVKQQEMRTRVLDVALELLNAGGRDAVSTRAVTSAAEIQAPTLYRIFGDKQGLLDAVALHGFEHHLAGWQGWQEGADPIDTLRQGWDMHVEWGLHNPQLYLIAYGEAHAGGPSSASRAIDAILRTLIDQVAETGRLTLPVPQAVDLLRAVGTGVVFTLITMPADRRDMSLSERGREAALAGFVSPASAASHRSGAAMQVKKHAAGSTALTPHERALLGDWLDRLALG